ncbi:MAG: hypothetical protein IJ306_00535 [Oscillospiraceae bacterium]|nr:hypothetical protein [Oscillospiraceae bacterium]
MKTFSLLTYTFSHFAVDYCCFRILFGAFSSAAADSLEIALGFITYNFIAFGLQMVIGAFCDKKRDFPAGALGCVLVFAALIVSLISPWAALLVTALGNAFFHVGGGIDSLVNSGGKLSRGGVFVSAGAIGVVLGTLHGSSSDDIIFPAILAAACAVLCYAAHKKCGTECETEFRNIASTKSAVGIVLALALVSVVIRSFGGTVIPMEWKTTAELALVSGFASFFGKFLGGFAADKFGARTTGVATLLLSIPFLVFGRGIMIISVIGVILFNMTMPITLGICAEKLPKNPGLAFGLTTAALLIGAVPSFFVVLGGNIALLVPAVIISAVCIFFAADNKKSALEVCEK